MAPFSIATTVRCRGMAQLISLDLSILPLIRTLYYWVLSKEVSSTIFKVFGMTRPGIEPRSPGLLANTLPTGAKHHYSGNCLFAKTICPVYLLHFFLCIIRIISKKNQADHVRTWFGQSGKWRSNPSLCDTKKLHSLFCRELLFRPSVRIRGPNCRQEKLKPLKRFRYSLLKWSFQEIKVKLNESRQLKFYQFKQLKENSTENSAEKNFNEDSQFNELWNISTKKKKKKKKRKILKLNEICFPDILSDKFKQIVLELATLYLFYPFLSRFFCLKFPFKNFIFCIIFTNSYPNYKAEKLTI